MTIGKYGIADQAHTRAVFITDEQGNPTGDSSVTVVDSTGDSAMDDANNALRVNVVASTGGGLTDAELRATPVPVSGTVSVTEPVTVDGTVTATVASTTLTATVTPAGDDAVVDGRQVVTTAGTSVQLSSAACKAVAITAETDNTGVIVIGASTVVAAQGTRRGIPMSPGDTTIWAVDNMNRLFIDSTVSGDGVTWVTLG